MAAYLRPKQFNHEVFHPRSFGYRSCFLLSIGPQIHPKDGQRRGLLQG